MATPAVATDPRVEALLASRQGGGDPRASAAGRPVQLADSSGAEHDVQHLRQGGDSQDAAPLRGSSALQAQKGSCEWAKWALVAFIATALAVGVIGLLVYTNVLELGLTNVGTMSQATGLYTMLAGLGTGFIAGLLWAVKCSLAKRDPNAPASQSCWSKLCAPKNDQQRVLV